MQKTTKKLLGLVGLALVVLLTIFAYLLPTKGAYAETAAVGTDTLRVTVYSQYPSIKINDPATDFLTTSPDLSVTFTYENASYVDFMISYVGEDGNTITTSLPRFTPDNIDPTYGYDSDTSTVTINLRDPGFDLDYGHYVIEAVSGSPIGISTGDAIEFDYAPAMLVETGTDENTNDPIVDVTYDDGVATIEVMPVDSNGNPLLDEPVVIHVTPDDNGNYPAGTQTITLPFTANGLTDGDYDIHVISYNADDDLLYSPRDIYPASYVQPEAPEAPNTGTFLGNLNIAQTDYAITIAILFAATAAAAFRIITRKKKDYRKNIRSRK